MVSSCSQCVPLLLLLPSLQLVTVGSSSLRRRLDGGFGVCCLASRVVWARVTCLVLSHASGASQGLRCVFGARRGRECQGVSCPMHWCSAPWLCSWGPTACWDTHSVSVVVGVPPRGAPTNQLTTTHTLHASAPSRCKACVGTIMPFTKQAMVLACTNTQHTVRVACAALWRCCSPHNTLQSVCGVWQQLDRGPVSDVWGEEGT